MYDEQGRSQCNENLSSNLSSSSGLLYGASNSGEVYCDVLLDLYTKCSKLGIPISPGK